MAKRPGKVEPAAEIEFDLDACHRAHCDCKFKLQDLDEDEILARAEEDMEGSA